MRSAQQTTNVCAKLEYIDPDWLIRVQNCETGWEHKFKRGHRLSDAGAHGKVYWAKRVESSVGSAHAVAFKVLVSQDAGGDVPQDWGSELQILKDRGNTDTT